MKMDGQEPPNGGWGWMVVAGAALINLVNQSMFANYGLIFGEYLKNLAHGHATGLTLVMAINIVVTNSSGLLVGPMLKRISIRTVTLLGIAATGSGMIISSFGTEIWHIVLGYSCLTGVGLGIIASGTFLAINDYFTTKKSTAVGISMAGTGLGQMLMPTLIGELLEHYGFSGTTFILGCMSFSGIIGAMFFKPMFCCKNCSSLPGSDSGEAEAAAGSSAVKRTDENYNNGDKKETSDVNPEEQKTLLDNKPLEDKKKKQSMIRSATESNFQETAMTIASSQHLDKLQKENITWYGKVSRAIGLHLLTDFVFVHILTGLGLGYVSIVTFSAFFPMFLQDELNMNVMQTTYCMTASSFADVIGRVTAAEIFRRLHLGNRHAFLIGCFLMIIVRSILVEVTSLIAVLALSLVTGYMRAIMVINQNLAISEYMDKDNLPSAIGLNMISKAIFTMSLGQSLGYLTDQYSYKFCIHILDVFLVIVVVGWLLETGIKRVMKR